MIAQFTLPFPLHAILIHLAVSGSRVGVHQRRQRATPDREPGDEGAELGGREQVDFEHGDRVGADGLVPEGVDAQLRELVADALPEGASVFRLW